MKTLFILLFSLGSFAGSIAQFNYQWVKQLGGSNVEYGYDIAVDNDGNVISCGVFNSTLDFDPDETGNASLTAVGVNNGYVSKLDQDGHFVWARSIQGVSSVMAVECDALGNVYCSGSFRNTVDFLAGDEAMLLTSNGQADAFLAKYSPEGELLWVFGIGAAFNDVITSITLDENQNLIVGGYFSDTVDFNPGNGEHLLTEFGGVNFEDAFAAKYDSDGNFIWVDQFGGDHNQYVTGLVVNSEGDIIVAGYFTSNIDCDPWSGQLIYECGADLDWQCYVVKLNATGNMIWGKSFGGPGQDAIDGPIALDEEDNIYATGYFDLIADFDPSVNVFEMIAPSSAYDAFITKMDTNGDLVWAKQLTGADDMSGQALDVRDGIVYTTGYVTGECDFDPGVGTSNIELNGAYDIYISALTTDGAFVWADRIGANEDDMGFAIVADDQYMYSTGYFRYNYATFGTEYLFSHGHSDSYVVKIAHPNSTAIEDWQHMRVELYPNPAEDFIYLKDVLPGTNIWLTDMMGKTVKKESQLTSMIDVSGLENGVYVLNVSWSDKHFTEKVVIR